MKIDRAKLDQIIQEEEIRLAVREAMNENMAAAAQVGKKVLIDTGVQMLTNMMQSQSGRENLASILTALPDFFKKTVCKIDPATVNVDSNIGALSQACGIVANVAGGPLYAVAKLLPMLSDDDAKVVVGAAKKIPRSSQAGSEEQVMPTGAEMGPGPEHEDEELVGEVTRPLPIFEEEDEDDDDGIWSTSGTTGAVDEAGWWADDNGPPDFPEADDEKDDEVATKTEVVNESTVERSALTERWEKLAGI